MLTEDKQLTKIQFAQVGNLAIRFFELGIISKGSLAYLIKKAGHKRIYKMTRGGKKLSTGY